MPWTQPFTKSQEKTYDTLCDHFKDHFGSYDRIAAALQLETGEYVSGKTVRNWIIERRIPTKYCVVLTDMTQTNPFHLLPWLKPYVARWSGQRYV